MKLITKFGTASGWKCCVAALILMLTLSSTSQSRASAMARGSQNADTSNGAIAMDARAAVESTPHVEIRNYFLDYAGDHSLDIATVIEQPAAGYAKYIVHLHLASGVEQSVVVSAPPGGLQIEMQDMTGDKIPNDVVLRPEIVRWLPTVLINDGHEHFSVAVPGSDVSRFSSPDNLGSRKHDSQIFALMMSSGFKTIHLVNKRLPFDSRQLICLLSPCTQTPPPCLIHGTSAGRAPPTAAV